MTAAEVQQEVADDLAYNTVQTILIRLHDKGILERRRAGRGHVYRPVEGESTAAASQMGAALANRLDRHAVLRRFAASLEEADADLLRQLLGRSSHTPL